MRRTFLLTILSTLGAMQRAVAQVGAPRSFEGRTYDERPSDLTGEPELAAAVADVLEAARRGDPSLMEPWLADAMYPIGEEVERPWSPTETMADLREDFGSLDVFVRALSAGVCLYSDGTAAVAPFTSEDLFHDVDELAVINEHTSVFDRPDASAQVVATLGHVVLRDAAAATEAEGDMRGEWMRVSATDGTHGYLRRDDTRQMMEFEVVFAKTSVGWRMTGFGTSC